VVKITQLTFAYSAPLVIERKVLRGLYRLDGLHSIGYRDILLTKLNNMAPATISAILIVIMLPQDGLFSNIAQIPTANKIAPMTAMISPIAMMMLETLSL